MNAHNPTGRSTKLFAPLAVLCLALLGAQAARADEVIIAGTTAGSFTNALSQNTGATLMGLSFINSSFNLTTAAGVATLNGSPATPSAGTNLNNLGSFYLAVPAVGTSDLYTGATFALNITFNAPTDITGGQQHTFTAMLTGAVVRTVTATSAGVSLDFDNTPITFSFANADGTTGSFTLTIDDVNGITPNFARALTGTISNASQTPAAATPTPEPASVVLLATGLCGALTGVRRRRGRASSD
jgi:hypothetical protein